jgi:hypothetical protein
MDAHCLILAEIAVVNADEPVPAQKVTAKLAQRGNRKPLAWLQESRCW